MAYRLKANESVPVGIKRIARERLDSAINQLDKDTNNSPEEAVHDARKRLKELRAIVRLVRDELGRKKYRQENICFRDAGRRLSEIRDAQVLIKTLDSLKKHFAESVAPDAFAQIREVLEEHYRTVREQVVEEENQVSLVSNTLKTARQRVDNWTIEHDNWSALGSGLKRVYKHGHQDFFHACTQPSVENLHEWRKRVKYLWYHLEVLEPVWPGTVAELANQAHRLADYLGEDHDLAVLHQFIVSHPERFENDSELEALIALLKRRRGELQSAAKFLGQRIYAEKARDFVDRLGAYWQAWQCEAQTKRELAA